MKIYLIRHAHAVAGDDDRLRPLSAEGRESCRRLAVLLRSSGCLAPMPMQHSGLQRAIETASLLAKGLGWPSSTLRKRGQLLPEDDPFDIAVQVDTENKDLALVGHEPHLSALATLLVRGKASPLLVTMKKGAVLCLERDDKRHRKNRLFRWKICWFLSPELFPGKAGRKKGKRVGSAAGR